MSHAPPLDTPDPADARVGVGHVPVHARLLAVGCLVLVPLGFASALYGFVRGMPDLLVGLVLVALAVGSVWMALGRRRVGRIVFLLFAAAFLGVAVWSVYDTGRQLFWIVLGALLLLAGGAAGRTALLASPRPARHHLHRPRTRPRKAVLFVNPHSGDGTAERVGLVAAARAAGLEVHELQKGDDLTGMARAAAEAGADCLGAAGGDGTQAQVALVCIERQLPFVCIPAGTRNHFALDLGLDRNDPLGGLSAFGDAYTKRIDVGEVNGDMFLNNVSIGAYGEVVAEEQYRENKIGTALAKLPTLIGPEAEPLEDLPPDRGCRRGGACEDARRLQPLEQRADLRPAIRSGRDLRHDRQMNVVRIGAREPLRVAALDVGAQRDVAERHEDQADAEAEHELAGQDRAPEVAGHVDASEQQETARPDESPRRHHGLRAPAGQ